MDLKHFFKLIIFGDKETPQKYGLAFAVGTIFFCIMALPGYLETIPYSHWWNTLGLTETSGKATLKQFEIEDREGRGDYFKLELVGLNNAPSLSYNKIEYGREIRTWFSDGDTTFVDYAKVWEALETSKINDIIPVKYVTNRKGEHLFTEINEVEDIGFFGDKGGFYISLFFTFTFVPFAFFAALNGEAAIPLILEMRNKENLNDGI